MSCCLHLRAVTRSLPDLGSGSPKVQLGYPEHPTKRPPRSKRGGRFVGCSGYPSCTFGLPLPKSGRLRVTARKCKQHDMRLIKVQTGKRLWDLGCPQCNYSSWIEKNKSK